MEDREKLLNFIYDFDNDGNDPKNTIEDLKSYNVTLENFIKSKHEAVRQKETEVFKAIIKLNDLRHKLFRIAKQKTNQLITTETREEKRVKNYFLNAIYYLDIKGESPEDEKYLNPPEEHIEFLKDYYTSRLIMKDNKGDVLTYLLAYNRRSLELEAVWGYEPEKPLEKTSSEEIESLIEKVNEFLEDGYQGIKNIVVNDLKKYLEKLREDGSIIDSRVYSY